MELRWLTAHHVDDVMAATELFDDPVRREWAQRFLDSRDHHLCLAAVDGAPAGFVSGVTMTHPDKGTEMFLYELGVLDRFQRRGIGRALVEALALRARELGCYGMWVLTDATNEAAVGTYTAAGATDRDEQLMLTWRLEPGHHTFAEDG